MQISIEHLPRCIYNGICCQIKGRKNFPANIQMYANFDVKFMHPKIQYLSPGLASQTKEPLLYPLSPEKLRYHKA